jgi:DNA polymerase-3 subunit alpha
MAALISSVMSTKDKVPFFVNRCDEMGIEVLPPCVNASTHGFVAAGKTIRFGLDAVKNVGHSAVETILSARETDGEFSSIYDFCERVDNRTVNKRAVECLIKCGALDSTGATRRGMLDALPMAAAAGQKAQEDTRLGQGSIFDLGGDGGGEAGPGSRAQHPPVGLSEFDQRELLRLEKETLGTFLSSHPLAEVRDALRAAVDCGLSALGSKEDGAFVTVGGIVTELKKIKTKNGANMAFATLDDVEGQVEMLVIGKAYEASAEFLAVDSVIVVRGRLDHKERGQTKLVATELESFEPSEDEVANARKSRGSEPLVIPIEAAEFGVSLIDELKSVLENFPGEAEVMLAMNTREGMRKLRFGDDYKVRRSAALDAELDAVLRAGAQAA